MTDIRSDAIAEQRFVLLLISSFGILALVLAAVGVYGCCDSRRRSGLRSRVEPIRAMGAP